MAVMSTTRAEGFTVEDRDAMPDVPHGGKYELVDGMLVVSPAPGPGHQEVVGSLLVALRTACPSELACLTSPLDIALPTGHTLWPDLVVVRRSAKTQRGYDGAPELAVEVLSPTNRRYDEVVKRQLYAEAGCPSYWIVDPGLDGGPVTLTALELRDEAYVEVARGTEPWTAAHPFPVTITPAELLD
jgi:Uma2 family endonuclease